MEQTEREKKLFKIVEDESKLSKQVILCSNFSKKKETPNIKTRQLKLFKELLVCSHLLGQPQPKQLAFTFDISFEIIREPSEKSKEPGQEDKKIPGKALGLRIKADGYKTREFYTDKETDLDKWETELRKIINQRGFHDLFRAMRKVGKGNFASVYLGQRLKDGKQFAIKAFAKQATYSQENGKAAIINEVKINRMFDHPNLMKLEGVFESDNSLYMVLQFIEGMQLFNKLQTKVKFSENQVKKIMKDLLQGLAEMARRNVIHRDLKPQNMMFRKDCKEIVIVDFGLATIADEKEYLFVRCGTPGYVAPEIINIKDLTTKSLPISDVFSVGAIFYHLLFGRSLFPGKTFNEVLTQNRQCDIELAGKEFDSIPYAAADLLRKMLQKQPQLRITAAQALRHSYFAQSSNKPAVFTPKIQFKESASCPTYLIDKSNEPKIRFIIKEQKSLLSKIASLDRSKINLQVTDIKVM